MNDYNIMNTRIGEPSDLTSNVNQNENHTTSAAQIYRVQSSADSANVISQSGVQTRGLNLAQSLDESDRIEIQRLKTMRKKIWNGLGCKDGVKVASLNIKGRRDTARRDKWPLIQTMMRKHNIQVLAIQEAHLDPEETEKLNEKYPKITIHSSGEHTKKEGVAFVINKEKLTCEYLVTEIIKGRVQRIQIKYPDNNGLDIVNVYAPNNTAEKIEFFETLHEELTKIEKDLHEPIIMGDFNFVESELDRYPVREDDARLSEAFQKIKDKFKLVDGWRRHHPVEKAYTLFMKSQGSMSRIDRIYMNRELAVYAYNWSMLTSARMSDHDCVIVEILKKKLPYIGEPAFRLNQDTIESPWFNSKAAKITLEAHEKMKEALEENKDEVQRTWMDWKYQILLLAASDKKGRDMDKNRDRKILNAKLKDELKKLDKKSGESAKKVQEKIIELREEIGEKSRRETEKLQESAKARFAKMGERCTKYWFNLQKPKKEGQVIHALYNPSTNRLTTETKEMTKIAHKYHQDLQAKPPTSEDREAAIKEMEEITERKLSEEQKEMLDKGITYDEVDEALRSAANGTSPGLDGIPYEFYKMWDTPKKANKEDTPDMVGMLHILYTDIERRGITKQPNTNATLGLRAPQFTDGLMTVLFKKKEKWKIENYRPITLLNNDYKLYTKTIANKLGKVAPTLLHENQAGFVPKRSLYDSTKTTHTIIEYCELNEINGCILALDQEKAYDKIDHDYMWRILKKNEFPDTFLARIQEMYKDTKKYIRINNIASEAYKVERGVHQGDPMSCLLYNLAIEPLAESIRRSELQGIKVDGVREKVVVSLFADDTLVYLRDNDDFKLLNQKIDTFCKASTAKFNIEKTEYLPIGAKKYREEVLRTRKVGENVIDNNLTLIGEGEVMRTLGAWVGNGNKSVGQWDKILTNQEKIIENCKKMHLSFNGKELILKALIQSRAVFLATVNGMPKVVEKKMSKMYHDLMWDGKKTGLMAWNRAINKKSEGGLNIPDLKARLEAIELVWTKRWLSPTKTRPAWAFVVDQILFKNIGGATKIEDSAKLSWALQTWHESNASTAKISPQIRNMLNTARKYGLIINAPKLSRETKNQLPAWLHHACDCNNNYTVNKKSAKCLRNKHGARTIGDLMNLDERELDEEHHRCNLIKNQILERLPQKMNPLNETPQKVRDKGLDFTPRRLEIVRKGARLPQFNPDVTARGEPAEEFRVFGDQPSMKDRKYPMAEMKKPAYKVDRESNRKNYASDEWTTTEDEESEQEWEDGKLRVDCDRVVKNLYRLKSRKMRRGENGAIKILIHAAARNAQYENGVIAFALYYGPRHERNKAICVDGPQKTILRATILATITALEDNEGEDLEISTVSETLYRTMTGDSESKEDQGWAGDPLKVEWKALLRIARSRNNKLEFKVLDSENEELKKEIGQAKAMARSALDEAPKIINLRTDLDAFDYEGARLTTITQKLAYQYTRERNAKSAITETSRKNLDLIKDEVMAAMDKRPTDEMIWKSLKKIEPFRAADFFWKMIHGKIKCGSYFRHMPQWAEKQFCTCKEVEDIDHIILDCEQSGVQEVWEQINDLWTRLTETTFPKPTKGTLMGVGTLLVKDKKGKIDTELSDLYRRLVETAAWSIWRVRNERIFAEEIPTAEKHIRKFRQELRTRIKMEFLGIALEPPERRDPSYKKFKLRWCIEDVLAKVEKDEHKWNLTIKY